MFGGAKGLVLIAPMCKVWDYHIWKYSRINSTLFNQIADAMKPPDWQISVIAFFAKIGLMN